MRVSVVIPNYNGAEIIKKNFPKVFESVKFSEIDSEIIICDDFSSDNSIEEIKNFIKEFKDYFLWQR